MEQCIFCKIANKQVPSTIIWEDQNIIAFKDLYPQAQIHALIIPKQHIESLQSINEIEHDKIMGQLLCAVPKIAFTLGIEHYQLKCHTGKDSGQEIFHLHLHLLQH